MSNDTQTIDTPEALAVVIGETEALGRLCEEIVIFPAQFGRQALVRWADGGNIGYREHADGAWSEVARSTADELDPDFGPEFLRAKAMREGWPMDLAEHDLCAGETYASGAAHRHIAGLLACAGRIEELDGHYEYAAKLDADPSPAEYTLAQFKREQAALEAA